MAEIKIRNMLILDEDRKKEISIDGEIFTINALFNHDHKEIARRIAVDQNGLPVNSFSMNDRERFDRDATVDTAVIDKPKWFTNATRCIDESVLDRLFTAINDWTAEFQEKLKKNQFTKRGE